MVFIGGSILASTVKDRPNFWLSRAEWKEYGPDRALALVKSNSAI